MSDRPSDSPDRESRSNSFATDEVRDRLPDAVAQYVPEEITRRQAVASVAGLTLGAAAISSNSNEKETFDRAQAQFSELATTIDESDLRNPRRVTKLKTTVSDTLANVASSLGPVVDQGANRTDVTATAEPDTQARTASQSARVREALTRAQVYYTNLENVLARAVAVHESLRMLEPVLLYNTDQPPSDPFGDVPLGTLDSAVESRLSASTPSTGESRSHVPELFPDRSAATSQLRELTRVFDRFVAVQRGTLVSGFTVVDATKHHEWGEFGKAQTAFATAREQADVQIPAQLTQYDIHDAGLTLGQYDQVLAVRRTGIDSLREASASELSESTRRASFNEGLERILQARAIITENRLC